MTTIRFNGNTYNSLDEMPANERQAYEHILGLFADKNGNGVPDFMEGNMAGNVFTAFTTSMNINGQTYNNINDLPPETRQKVEQALAKLQSLGIMPPNSSSTALPDSSMTSSLSSSNAPQAFEPAFQPSQPMIAQLPITPESTNWTGILLIAVVLGALICGATAVAFFMLR